MIKTKSLLLCVLFCLVCSKINADERIMIFGDSLSSAYGIDRHDGWVELLRKKLTRVPSLKRKLEYKRLELIMTMRIQGIGLLELLAHGRQLLVEREKIRPAT